MLEPLGRAADNVALDRQSRANLGFALGRALDSLGMQDRAFAAFQAANRRARQTGPTYSRQRTRCLTDALIADFPGAGPAGGGAATHGPADPVFICGMLRSGSTLLEQALADDYRSQLARLFPEAARSGTLITDKRPDSFLLIGLIKQLFSDAKIIHTVRHPLDNGFSIFMQHLDQRAMPYSSDLAEIGHHFGQYRCLTAQWQVIYGDSILEFDYDAFVREPRPTLENTVKTASYWQVRRPLSGEASVRLRHCAAHLASLAAALRDAGVPDIELF